MDILKVENNVIKTKDLSFNEDMGGIGAILFKYMKIHGNRVAQVDADSGKLDTFTSLLQKCVRTAIALERRGIKKGDFVSLCSDIHLNACVPIVAAQFLGAIPFSIEPSLAIQDLINLLKQIQPKIIFIKKCSEDMIKTCFEIIECRAEIVIFEEEFENEFLSTKKHEDNFEPVYIKDLEETAFIYFSSGTTGLPKPVLIKHYTLITTCNELTNEGNCPTFFKKTDNPVFLSFTNWYWISSGWALLCSTVGGVCRILSNHFDPVGTWHLIDTYKVTSMFLSPLKVVEFCEAKRPKDVDLSSLILISYGGSALPEEYIVKLRQILPNAVIIQGYAQTEVGITLGFGHLEDERQLNLVLQNSTALGTPSKGIWYKIVDPETEKSLGINQPGELRIKTRRIMNGYYNRESKSCYDEEGFFKTGDMLYYDENFCFYFVQRLKELLKYREWSVFPAKLENILLNHPAVKNAVVIGKPHKVDGDHPMGVVILKDNCHVTEEELRKFVNDRVEERQKLRGGIKFVESYPLTVTGKINKNLLKKIALKT